MVTPFESLGARAEKAELQIVQPSSNATTIPIQFNPAEFQLQKQNNFADINIPGLETPPIQFVRGSGEKLTTELIVDTSDTLEDVRTTHVNKLRALMNINKDLHAPPVVKLVWSGDLFCGVLDSLSITYVMFSATGVPLRARLSVSLKEYRTVDQQVKGVRKESPDVDKSYTVAGGDTITSIAFRVFRDASKWRDIARANGIRDPRTLVPGTTLSIPKLT